MLSDEPFPSAPPSQPAEVERSPSARPGSKWGGRGGQPEKMERAPRHGPPRPSRPASEGEKDSGFSDGSSEYPSATEQTDTEDQADPPLPPGPAKLQKAQGGLLGGAFPGGLAPLYLAENAILKQTQGAPPAAPFLAWSNQRPLESARSPAAHLLLLQQPVASLKPMLPSQKPSSREIASPPSALTPESLLTRAGSLRRRPTRLERPADTSGCARGGEARPSAALPTAEDSCEALPEEPAPVGPQTSTLVCPAAPTRPPCAGPSPVESRMAVRGPRRPGGHSLARQRHLRNMVEILRRSGLLGVALRTKELLRQNRSTQWELDRLREQARLLCEAVRSSEGLAWAHLQDTIGRSAAPWPSKGAGAQPHSGQQLNLAALPLLPGPGLALGPDTALPAALP